MKIRISCLFVLFCFILSASNDSYANSVTDAVVKIFATTNQIDFYRPWQSVGADTATGSGTIIAGNKILTNAHVVSQATFIQVKKDGDSRKYTAKLEAIGHDCDLALLTVEDLEFFEGTVPLEFGELPQLQDTVVVIGYPQGGDKLSITGGVVSRIEITGYSESARKLLTVQIDAAINPGNSGGPVIKDGKIVGVAMQVFQTGQNIGYMIPIPIVQHFFDDLKDSRYDGFPIIGVDFYSTENKALKDYYQIDGKEGGVVINKVFPYSPAYGILKEADIILKVDGTPIGEDGTFEFRDKERLILPHLITQKQIDEEIPMQISRGGKIKDVVIKLKKFVPLVPYPEYFQKPPYYIYGGMVFTVLSTDLLRSWGPAWWEKSPLDFNYYLLGQGRLNSDQRQEIIVLLNVLSDDINIGYHGLGEEVIAKVNGKKFNSFKEFVLLLNGIKSKEKFTILETEQNFKLILNNKNIEQINKEIVERNNISSEYSEDVAGWLKNGR